eukprot:9192539-Ditylum_brightwellii.AAC.1
MRTEPDTYWHSNPNVKLAVLAFMRPTLRNIKSGQFHTYKLRTTPADTDSPTNKLSIPFYDK